MKIARQPELFDVTRSFKAWVYTVATNLCKMEYRKAGRRGHAVSLDNAPELKAGDPGITERIDKKAFAAKLKEVLQSIDEPHKSTFVLRYFDELSESYRRQSLDTLARACARLPLPVVPQ